MSFCGRCGGALEERGEAGRTRLVCTACGRTTYRNPLPVAACLVEEAGGLYLIRRRNEPGRDLWALPAGFIEHGEMPPEAAARETAEETGLTVTVGALAGVYGYIEGGGARSGIIIAYEGAVVGGQATAGDDAVEVRRFDPTALPFDEIAFDTHRAALRDWLARRR